MSKPSPSAPLQSPRGRAGARTAGFAYLWLLFLVVILGVGLAAVASVWHTAVTREKERELLFVGDQFRKAIASYRQRSPAQQGPHALEDLLQDTRFPNTVRHLRRIYTDPMTGGTEWGLVQRGDQILGVYSLAEGTPRKQAGFGKDYEQFSDATQYGQWIFTTETIAQRGAGSQPSGPGGTTTGAESPTEPGDSAQSPAGAAEPPPVPRPQTACAAAYGQAVRACVQSGVQGTDALRCRGEAQSEYWACLGRRG